MITLSEQQVRNEFAARREEMALAHQAALVALNRSEMATLDALKVGKALQSLAVGLAQRAGEK